MSITVKKLLGSKYIFKHNNYNKPIVYFFQGKTSTMKSGWYLKQNNKQSIDEIIEKINSNPMKEFGFSEYFILDIENIQGKAFQFYKDTENKKIFFKDNKFWCHFNNNLYEVLISKDESYHSFEELEIIIKEKIYRDDKRFNEIKKQVEMYEKFEQSTFERREPIPEDVRFEVWRRDGGKCVMCGSQKNLEFDHIIPVSKGGANTTRNLQLLCQDCNRHKSNKI